MRLLPARTRGEGDCALHALGQWNGQEYVYDDILTLRKKIGNKVRAITVEAHNLFPSVSEAIKELIRGNNQQIKLDAKKFPLLTARQQQYDKNNEDFEDLENFDTELNGPIVKEYAKFIETPGMWLLPCELSVVAYALKMTIHQFGKGKYGEITYVDTYNPGPHTQPVANVYFNGINHYEAMAVEESIFTKQSTEIIADKNQTYPTLQREGSHPASGVKLALHGTIYQLKMIVWVLHSLHELKFEALISTEDDHAGKWDDLVVRQPNSSESKRLPFLYRFFQFKHKQGNEVISYGDLVTSEAGEFSLAKYLRSFLKIKKEKRFTDGALSDFCLCTNIGFDFSPKNTRDHLFSLQDALEEIKKSDPLLKGQGKRYRFKKDFKGKGELYTILKQNGDEMVELAKALSTLMQTPTEKIKKNTKPFNNKELYQWLLDEKIVDDTTKRVTPDFLASQNLSQEALDFKALYDQGQKAKGVILTDTDIDKFFKHLVFAVNLPNEVELGRYITQKLGTEFNLLDAKFLSANLLEELLDWMKEKTGSFLSTAALGKFFEEMREQLSRLTLIGPTIDYQRKLEGPGITFSPSQKMLDFLKGKQRVAIYQVAGDLFLGGMRIYQTVQTLPTHQTNDGYIFVTLTKAVRLGALLIDAFKKSQLLVLSCNIPVEGGARTLLEDLFNTESTAKIILITPANQAIAEAIPSNIKPYTLKANASSAALSSASQEKLKKQEINFQGKLLTLANLPDALDAIDEAGLAELLKGTPEIGKPLEIITDSLLVPRTFNHTVTIKETGLTQNNSDIFALATAMSQKELKTILGKDHLVQIFTERANTENTEATPQELARHIILDANKETAFAQFTELSRTHPTQTIHYLRYENKQWVWQRSQGSLAGLRPYLDASSTVSALSSRNVVVAAEPGMGKSWWLANYAQQLKQQDPEAWVLHITLLEQEEKLKHIHFNSIDDIIAFFTQDASALARRLFTARLRNTGKLIICLDGFDELQAPQQAKVIQLLQLLKSTQVQQVIITTRQHLQATLEDTLNTFAYGLIPFAKKQVREYLGQFWQAKLSASNTDLTIDATKVSQYARALMKVFSGSVKEADHFIGIPLQARLLAEAFAEEAQTFYLQNDSNTPEIEAFSLAKLYHKFIHAKYQLFFQEKSKLSSNNYFLSLQNSLITHLDHDHQYYAFTLLFPSAPPPIDLLTGTQEALQTAGIIQFIADKPYFIHRTFAEYFVAQFLIQQLNKPKHHSEHQQYKAFLIHEIFKARNAVIKAFLEGFVEQAQDDALTKIWEEICGAHFLPEQTRHFVIDTEISIKNAEIPSINQNPTTLAELKKQVLRARAWVDKAAISAIANSARLYCEYLLETQNHQTITEALETLYQVVSGTDLYTVRDAITAHLSSIIWHYALLCPTQSVAFAPDKITPFITYFTKKKEHSLVKGIQAILDLQPYLDPTKPLPDDFMEKLSPQNWTQVIFLRKLPITETIAQKLTERATYKSLHDDSDYHTLLSQLTSQYLEPMRKLLIDKKNYTLLHQLSIQQPKMALTVTEIESLFADNKDLFWLERTGIELVNTFRILTPKMATIFSDILLQGTNGYYTNYAHDIWYKLLLPLINTFYPNLAKPGINRYALIEMCVRFMAFSLMHTPSRNFSPTEQGLRNLLVLTQEMLSAPILSAAHLENGVNFLYSLHQYGLIFIDTMRDNKKTLLILDPQGEFSFSLALSYHNTMRQLLTFKAEYSQNTEDLAAQCRQAILTMRGLSSRKRSNPFPLSLEDLPLAKGRIRETKAVQPETMEIDQ